jgi:hypothetical protein
MKTYDFSSEKASLAAILSSGNLSKAINILNDENVLKLRQTMLEFIANINDLGHRELALFSENIDKKFGALRQNFFDMFLGVYCDIIMLKIDPENEYIINQDITEYFTKISKELDFEKLIGSVKAILNARKNYDANVNFQLIIYNLAVDLRSF